MLYHLLYPLHEIEGLSFLNIFRYITFRSAYAAVTSLAVCFLFGPAVVAGSGASRSCRPFAATVPKPISPRRARRPWVAC